MKYLLLALVLFSCKPRTDVITQRIQAFEKKHPECHVTTGNKDNMSYLLVEVRGVRFPDVVAEGQAALHYGNLIEEEILKGYVNQYGYSIDFPDNRQPATQPGKAL